MSGSSLRLVQIIADIPADLRCGRDGRSLPVEKYDQWQDIKPWYDPERTSFK